MAGSEKNVNVYGTFECVWILHAWLHIVGLCVYVRTVCVLVCLYTYSYIVAHFLVSLKESVLELLCYADRPEHIE